MNQINRLRSDHGTPHLQLSQRLMTEAQTWAANITTRNVWEHNKANSNHADLIYSEWYENWPVEV